MMRFASLLFVGLTLTAPVAHAATWSVDGEKSKLGFVATQNEKPFNGEFKTFKSDIAFDPADLANSKAVILIDTASIDTEGFSEKDNDAAKGPDWFDSKSFAMAKFETTAFRSKGGNAYEADAKLTIRDVTKDVTLPFTLDIAGDTAKMKGELTINRVAFNVGQGQFAKGKWFGLDVKVVVDLTATKAQ